MPVVRATTNANGASLPQARVDEEMKHYMPTRHRKVQPTNLQTQTEYDNIKSHVRGNLFKPHYTRVYIE